MDVNSTYYFALRATNQNGQISAPSNIARLRFSVVLIPNVLNGLSVGEIVGIVVGGLAFISFILVLVFFARKKYLKDKEKNRVESA